MPKEEDTTRVLPLVFRLRLAHDFADEDEKKQIEQLADNIIAKHPDIQKILKNQGFMGQMVTGPRTPGLPWGCGHHFIPCVWDWTV